MCRMELTEWGEPHPALHSCFEGCVRVGRECLLGGLHVCVLMRESVFHSLVAEEAY